MKLLGTIVLMMFMALPAWAITIETPLADAAKEREAHALFRRLKCVVCEGQALAESDATLARQMRAEIRRLVLEGKSSNEIQDYFVARYGRDVLLDPPLTATTVLLWCAPLLVLGVGAYLIKRSAA